MDTNALEFEFISYYPKDFYHKSVNEPFIQKIMASAFPGTEWVNGNPNNFEPDYFCNGVPFEFTIASDSKKRNNLIQKLLWKKYSTEDVEQDVISYIQERIQDKASKRYSVNNVHLCVLCLLDLSDWVSDYYGSYTHELGDYRRKQFFADLRDKYINTGVFNNIFIIFPDLGATWWVYDVLTEKRSCYSLTDEEILSGTMPYSALKELYESYFPVENGS